MLTFLDGFDMTNNHKRTSSKPMRLNNMLSKSQRLLEDIRLIELHSTTAYMKSRAGYAATNMEAVIVELIGEINK